MKLVNLSEVINEIEKFKGYLDEDMIWRIKFAINRLPATDAESVKHGKWIRGDLVGIDFITEVYLWKCSECGEEFKETENNINHYHYCTNCGAKMIPTIPKEIIDAVLGEDEVEE